jgi:hypothetical protein
VRACVILSELWLRKAIKVGEDRHAYALAHHLKHYGLKDDDHFSHHIIGAVGECAVAAFFQLRWNPNIGVITGVDVSGKIEVRARRLEGTGLDLAMRPKDKDDLPYVLVWVSQDYMTELIGWLYGWETKGKGQWCDSKQVWFIPPPYRGINELREHI